MRTKALIIAITVAVPVVASAHHSAAIFDRQQVVAFQGTVTKFSWTNPHVYIYVETVDDAGQLVEWEIETDATPILTRSGWTAKSLVPGERATVRVNPDKNVERKHGLLVSVSKSDGATMAARSYFLRGANDTKALARASDMSGIWELSVLDYEPFYEKWAQVELTPKAIAAQAAYDIRRDNPSAQCIPMPTPNMLTAPYLNQIVLGEDVILVRNERYNLERKIYMDGRGHPDGSERSNQGHSIGRWEDEVLVVDTTHFADNRSGNARGVPSGSQKHLVERFELNPDRTGLTYRFVLEDPEYLAAPVTGELQSVYRPGLEFEPVPCDRESATRFAGD